MVTITLEPTRTQLGHLVVYLNKAEARDKICRAIQYGSRYVSMESQGLHKLLKKVQVWQEKFSGFLRLEEKFQSKLTLGELGRLSASKKKLEKELKQADKYKDERYRIKLKQEIERLLSLIKSSLDVVVAIGLLQLAPNKVSLRLTGAFGFITSLISCYQLLPAPAREKTP